MFTKILITLGILGMAGALIYFMVADKSEGKEVEVVENTKLYFVVSAAMVPAGYILRYLGKLVGVGTSRCRKCGKRIGKGEMFCFDHSFELVQEAKERTRHIDSRPKPRS
jgi:hypothetical protein